MDPSAARQLRRVRTLGRGASGAVVWLASDDASGQLLAVKSAAAAGGAGPRRSMGERDAPLRSVAGVVWWDVWFARARGKAWRPDVWPWFSRLRPRGGCVRNKQKENEKSNQIADQKSIWQE